MNVTTENFTDVMEYLDKQPELSCDTETTGLRYHDRLFSVQFATAEKSYYLDKRLIPEHFAKIGQLFKKPREWYLQNPKFDMKMLHWEGWHLDGRISDLEVLARLDKNDRLSTKLAHVAKEHGFEKLDNIEKWIKAHPECKSKVKSKYWDKTEELLHYDRVPWQEMALYGPIDTRITFDISKILRNRLDPKCVPVYDLECALTPICFEMEMGGALIDPDYCIAQIDYESKLIADAKNKFLMITGHHYDGSKTQLIDIFTQAGETIPKTAKGNPSLTGDILETFSSPAAKCVQEITYFEKRISTYYSSFLDLADDRNFIHPDMRQAGTTTGRFSYRDPNLQNIPKEDDASDLLRPNLVRACFVPLPGHTLVSMDYSQQEYRLMLAYAKQHGLIREVMGGMDLHEATAKLVGITRKQAKTLNFAILYGAGDEKLAWMLGITIDEASRLRAKYFAALPMVQFLIAEIKRKVKSRGHVYNWMGRKLNLPGGFASNAYAVPNHLIQGSGADVCKKAMVDIWPALKGTGIKIQKQVHDQLLFQWPNDQFDKIPLVKEIMEDVFPEKNGMRMKVDVAWSKRSFAEAHMVKGVPA